MPICFRTSTRREGETEMTGPRDEKDTSYSESSDGTHHTWYDGDGDRHMSYDTDKNGEYVEGSGHETDHSKDRDNGRFSSWSRDDNRYRD